MLLRQTLAIVAPTLARSFRRWIFHLGGLGFIPLGLLDSSVIPLPGSMDVLTIILSAHNQELWLYYALMATLGSVMGGYITYRLARKGGKETLETQVPRQDAREHLQHIRAMGFWSYRHRRLVATACAHGCLYARRRRDAILRQKVSLRTDARPNCPIFPPGLPGRPLWT